MLAGRLNQIADALVVVVGRAVFAGAPVRAERLSGSTRAGAGSVVVRGPALDFDELGEGFTVPSSQWELDLWSAHGDAEVSEAADYALVEAVLHAIGGDATLGGVVQGVMPTSSPIAEPAAFKNDRPTKLRRVVTLTVYH